MCGFRARARTVFILVFAVVSLNLAGQQASGGFTSEQVAQGQAAYTTSCASCHQPDLRGAFEANPLVGPTFMNKWASRPASELIHYVQGAMPPDRPGSLGAQAYVSLVAYILQSNGGAPGSEPLGARSEFAIGTVATGGSPAAVPSAPAAGSAQAPAGGAGQGNESPRGLTVSGLVNGLTPVTDEMLRSPDPRDWLMVRGDYAASSYTALGRITRDNVGNLRLAWVWQMNEGGVQAPSPIVHDGTMFLANTAALFRRSTRGPASASGSITSEPGTQRTGISRSMAIAYSLRPATPDSSRLTRERGRSRGTCALQNRARVTTTRADRWS